MVQAVRNGAALAGSDQSGEGRGQPLLPASVIAPGALRRQPDDLGLPVEGHRQLPRRDRERAGEPGRGPVLPASPAQPLPASKTTWRPGTA